MKKPETHKQYIFFIKNYCTKYYSKIDDLDNLIGESILSYYKIHLKCEKENLDNGVKFGMTCSTIRMRAINLIKRYTYDDRTDLSKQHVSLDKVEEIAIETINIKTYSLNYILEKTLKQYPMDYQIAVNMLKESFCRKVNTDKVDKIESTRLRKLRMRFKKNVIPILNHNKNVLEKAGVL